MHMVIRAIVYAEDGLSALERAREIFSEMCGDYRPFDCFVTFDEEGYKMSGKDRWGELPIAPRADSPAGKKLIAEGWNLQVASFRESLKKVRRQILSPWKKLISNSIWRYRCKTLYDDVGPDIYLYDADGAPIGDKDHLENVLNKWECLYDDEEKPNPYKDLKVFVVPADVHY